MLGVLPSLSMPFPLGQVQEANLQTPPFSINLGDAHV